jgi:hypothetical protein
MMIRARHPNLGKPDDEIEIQKGQYILDIEYRGATTKPKMIRYLFGYDDESVYLEKYNAQYKKYYR